MARGAGRATIDLRAQARYLLREWRAMFRPSSLVPDALAGVAVALVALPLSLAIANASGVSPRVGLVTAAVGGVVVALFGGCRLQVSGPAAALTFLCYEVVERFEAHGREHGLGPGLGLMMLVAATLLAGLFQVVSGVLRLGRLMQFVPRPVVVGFLSGIGITIVCTQLPKVLGYDVRHDEEGGALGLLWQTVRRIDAVKLTSLAVGATAAVLMFALPRLSRRLPAPLVAVAVAALLPAVLGWDDVARLGTLPAGLPAPALPVVPWHLWNELVMIALTIYVLASIESLLSASVVNSLAKGTRTDNDQELVGQGLGNLASALFGGLPVTGVIARSATNVQSGARTRLAAVVHALIVLGMLVALAPLVARIPVAALAGVLIAVAVRMVEIGKLKALWHGSRVEAAVYLVTAGAVVATDLMVGVAVGLAAAFVYFAYEMSRLSVEPVPLAEGANGNGAAACPAVTVLRVDGPLFFASADHLRIIIDGLGESRCVVFDIAGVPFLDVTGAETLEEAIEQLGRGGVAVVLARPTPAVRDRLRGLTLIELHALRDCPVYLELRDALLHAASLVGPDRLCDGCRAEGRCLGLGRALEGAETTARTPVPRVRAVLSRSGGGWRVEDVRGADAGAGPPSAAESLRPSPPTSWNTDTARPEIHPTAFVDPHAAVIGAVTVAASVYVGPGVSVRADEGAPFFIGAGSNLQDGATVHALKGKVVLVEGRAFAVYVGRNVCCTHHALIHGPCYIGDGCFIGFKSSVHDSVIGEGCVLGIGATVVGVSLPPRRYVRHHDVVDTQEKADALPEVGPDWEQLRDDVVAVNRELAAGHRAMLGAGRG
jgi:high affinity sulfate transporter 1